MRTLVGADEPERWVSPYPLTQISVCSGAGGLPVWWTDNAAAAPVVTWHSPDTAGANRSTYLRWVLNG